MSIDLNPYGLSWTLDPIILPPDYQVAKVVRIKDKLMFAKPNGEQVSIHVENVEIGRGSYGRTWLSTTELDPGVPIVIKMIKKNKTIETDVIKETLIQIIIYETTKDLVYPDFKGPFCPKLYLFGADNAYYYIVSERMEETFLSLFVDPPPIINTLLKQMLVQLCTILEILYDRLKFNHRDLKPDNIMYVKRDGKFMIRLIDFGFSCLEYRGLNINPDSNTIKELFQRCFIETRDLHQMFHQLIQTYTIVRKENEIREDFPMTRIMKTLIYRGLYEPEWSKTYKEYNLLNTLPKYKPRNLTPSVVKNVFSSIQCDIDDIGSFIRPNWTEHLIYVNEDILANLTTDEINNLPKQLLNDWLETVNIHDIINKFSSAIYEYKLYMNILRVLLKHNPQIINLQDKQGKTPIMIVSNNKNVNLLQKLLELPNIKLATQDINGNTMLHYLTNRIQFTLIDSEKKLIEKILEKNPVLADIKNNNGEGPGNIHLTHSSVHAFIKTKKSTIFRKHKNTNLTKKNRRKR